MKKFVTFLLLFSLVANGGCGGGGDKPKEVFQILGYVHDFGGGVEPAKVNDLDGEAETAKVELWTLDGTKMLAGVNVPSKGAPFVFPDNEEFAGRLLLSADVPNFGRMVGIADTTQPTIESITPLSTLILEVADGDYSEEGIDKAEEKVGSFIGISRDDDYSADTLFGIVPLDSDAEFEAFDPTGFSYQKFKDELMSDESGKDFNEAISDWAERAREGEVLPTPLVVPKGLGASGGAGDFFTWILKAAAEGAVSYVGGQAAGWLLNLITGGSNNKDVLDAIASMSKKLDEIQMSLHRFEADIKALLTQLNIDITHIGMKPNLDVVQTAYNIHLMEIAKSDLSKERRQQKIDAFVSDYATALDRHLLGIDSGIKTTETGGKGIYRLMADNAMLSIRKGDMTFDGAVTRYVAAYTYFVGIQIKGLLCKIEVLNKINSKNDSDRKKEVLNEIARFNKRMEEQSALFMDGAEILVLTHTQNSAGTFNYHKDGYMPKSDNPYSVIDAIAADSCGFEAQVVFRMMFDPKAPDRLWGQNDRWWRNIRIFDYADYFSGKIGIKEKMQKLADNQSSKNFAVHLQNMDTTKGKFTAANGEFGSVQKVSWQEPGDKPIGKEAVVMRWVFGGVGITSKDVYRIIVGRTTDLSIPENLIYRKGTIGTDVLKTGDNILRVQMEGKDSFSSIQTFAWLPDNFLYTSRDDPSVIYANHHIEMQLVSRMVKGEPAFVNYDGVSLRCYMNSPLSHHSDVNSPNIPMAFNQTANWDRNNRALFNRYKVHIADSGWASITKGELDRLKYYYRENAYRLFFMQPPAIMSMFLDDKSHLPTAKEPIYVRYGYPLYIGMTNFSGQTGYWKSAVEGYHYIWANNRETYFDSYWQLRRGN